MTWTPHRPIRRWPGPATLVMNLVRRVFGTTDRPDAGHEYAQMSQAGYHPSMAPPPADAPREVVRISGELAAAVDEGNGHILDAIVQAWGENWCDEELRQHNARASILRMHALNARAWHERCEDRIAHIEDELRYTEAQLVRLGAPAPEQRTAPHPRPATKDEI